ncbi:glycosyltransferase [Parabacteroides johnsonii]
MNVLCDLISFQSGYSGGGEYTKTICKEIITSKSAVVYGLFDSEKYIHSEYLLFIKEYPIQVIDIRKTPLSNIIRKYSIERIFIGVQSLLNQYDFKNVSCKMIVTVHDLRNHDIILNNIRGRLIYRSGLKAKLKQFVSRVYPTLTYKWAFSSLDINLLKKENVYITTVSNYSKAAIQYYYPQLGDKDIPVYYPPLKTIKKDRNNKDYVENKVLRKLVWDRKKYFLLVSGGVPEKNIDLFLRVFNRLSEIYPSYFCVVTGLSLKSDKDNILFLDYLSSSDLEYAYAHATIFVYPTYQEGFGYPPLEAMKYGVPCCISNVTSLPEIYGDSVVYFSPFYEADLFEKILYILEHFDLYRSRSLLRYEELLVSLNKSLFKIVDYILTV